jgi:tetratricopeptide (TPR) repeat protein
VVGDLIGTGSAQEQAVVGETPNFAARLQVIAEPNTVVISDSTRRLLGNLFEFEDLGAKDLKGISAPMRAWTAVRPSAVDSRFEALHGAALTALVGREEELELLSRRWSRAKTGEGQVVLLSGEAGIGKSRLTAALLEHLASEPHTRLRYFCSPQHADSAFYPIISQMERAAGFVHDDIPQARLDKLDMMLAQTSTSKQNAALLAEMLSLPNDRRYPPLDLTPEQRRQRTLQALVSQMEALAGQSPVLMIFEDAHWSDPTSLEVVGRIVDRIATLRVLLLVTFRLEFTTPWIGQPRVTAVTLSRLPRRYIDAMIDGVIGNKLLLASIRQDIIERTDGIPLFIEEMTKAVLEADSEDAALRTAAAIPPPILAVPASLQASLMARLDRLGPAKEIAQTAAAIGREFSHALLAAVVRKPEAELQAALNRLATAGLLFRQGIPPHTTYLFKHALVQDAAYGTLLRESRRSLHRRIAAALESQFPEIVESQPELLARHCTEAGLIEKAAGLWGKAGQRSLAQSALVEAVEQLSRAISQMATLRSTPELRREEIKVQVALINPLIHVKGYASPETKSAVERAHVLIERAEALGEPLEDPLLLFSVLYGFWVANYVAFNGDLMRELAAQFLSLAEKQKAIVPRMTGHRIVGTTLLYMGDFAKARLHLDQALALYDPIEHRPLAARFGTDAAVSSLILSIDGSMVIGLSRRRTCGCESYRQGRARNRSSVHVDGCLGRTVNHPHPLREVRGRNGAAGRSCRFGRRKGFLVLEGACRDERLRIRLDKVALMTPNPDAAKAEAYFKRALEVARQQQAKSWELRAAMSMARLWRDQGKRDAARDLLAPVYGWFTEGFDTLDLKDARALLDELSA